MSTDHGVRKPRSRRYSAEEKQAAVRMVRSLRAETESMTGTVRRVAEQAWLWGGVGPRVGSTRLMSMRVPCAEVALAATAACTGSRSPTPQSATVRIDFSAQRSKFC